MTTPTPASDAERALARARAADDRREYFRLLTTATLYLPVPDGDVADAPQQFVTWDLQGRRYLVVYTSPELLVESLQGGVSRYTTTTCAELREKWPNPDWHLAVNPVLPLDCYLPIDAVFEAASGNLAVSTATESVQQVVGDDPELRAEAERSQALYQEYAKAREAEPEADEPVGETEVSLELALGEGDVQAYLSALLESTVLLPTAWPVTDPQLITEPSFPWRAASGAGSPTIEVFTSEGRFTERYPADTPVIIVPFAVVLTCWPDPAYALVANPDSRYELRLVGDELDEVIGLAEDLLIELDEAEGGGEAGDRGASDR